MYGASPPEAVIACEYATPASAFGSVAGAIASSVLCTRTVSCGPAMTGTGVLSQSRDFTAVTPIRPSPSGPADVTCTSNSVPPVVMPHGRPSVTRSTWYAPPPSGSTCMIVFGNASAHEPSVMLDSGCAGVQSASIAGSSCSVTFTPRTGVDSPRV